MDYRDIIIRLASVYDQGEARAVARRLLEDAFGMTYADICCGKITQLSREEEQKLENFIIRLENSEPVQYVVGRTDFYGRTFHVEPGVLIPRPETEELVDWIVNENMQNIEALQHPLRILDVGTGSGCIAVSLALALHSQVDAWDISAEALRIAKGNAMDLGAENVSFAQVDVLDESLRTDNSLAGNWDIVVSNPPYICHKEADEMSTNVLDYEPSEALFVPDNDPLLFYRAIACLAWQRLKPYGQLYFELNRAYADDTARMVEEIGFSNIEVHNDQFGNPRMLRCTK